MDDHERRVTAVILANTDGADYFSHWMQNLMVLVMVARNGKSLM